MRISKITRSTSMFKNRHEVDFGDSELSILVLQELEVNGNNYQRKVKNRKLKKKILRVGTKAVKQRIVFSLVRLYTV